MTDHEVPPIDIGYGHSIRFYGWAPDRALNPQYAGLPDIDRAAVEVTHTKPDGSPCMSAATFDTVPGTEPHRTWHVEQDDPLTLSPSLLCTACGDHGFIRNGQWVPA
ncbi:MAG TPA: DUF6527 family protein [Pseudonocardiaceae bacterium]|nr:DUF6527 family protein [Pseudonocardiaceae bacterium]